MLITIAALRDPKDQERQLLKIANHLAPDAIKGVLLGRGPVGVQNCARLLDDLIVSGRQDKALAPMVEQIERRAVRSAAQKVINQHGRINYGSRFAQDLVPCLTNLAISELVRLKLRRILMDLRSRFSR